MRNIFTVILKPSGKTAKVLIFVALIALLAAGVLGYLDPVRAILEQERFTVKAGQYNITLYRAVMSLVALIIFFWIAAIVSEFGEKRIAKMQGMREGNKALMTKLFQILLYFIAFILALDIIGIDLTAFAVLGGALGIGLGFGLQKIAANFISGLILLFEKSLENGDLIELTDGTLGFIRHTGARYTLLETWDQKEVMVPNEELIINRVTNLTFSNSEGRVDLAIGVSYDSDLDKVHDIILEAATEEPRCMRNPEPQCYLRDFGDSSVNFLLYFWVGDVTQGRYRPQSNVMFSIWRKFKENGVVIPFPQRDLHIKDMPRDLARDYPLADDQNTKTS